MTSLVPKTALVLWSCAFSCIAKQTTIAINASSRYVWGFMIFFDSLLVIDTLALAVDRLWLTTPYGMSTSLRFEPSISSTDLRGTGGGAIFSSRTATLFTRFGCGLD